MKHKISILTIKYLLVMMGSISAGLAIYMVTGDPLIGTLTFATAIGLVTCRI